MKTMLAPGLAVKASKIDGKGCFATIPFKKDARIAEYAGEKIPAHEIAQRLKGQRRIYICELNSGWAIDGSREGNGTQYINHSCAPNCYARIIRGRLIFFAMRDIEPGEEILLDYEDSYHSDKKQCTCGAPSCRGRINKT